MLLASESTVEEAKLSAFKYDLDSDEELEVWGEQ